MVQPKDKLRHLTTEIEKQRNLFVPLNRRNDLLEAFWQLRMYTLEPPICIPKHCRRSAISGQHATYFRKSRILSNAVPLGCYFGGFTSTAGYVPATRLKLSPERLGSPLAFISRGCYPFFYRRSERLALSLQALRLTLGVIWNNARLPFRSPGRHRHVRRSLFGHEPVRPATRGYTGEFFCQTFCVLLFR